MDLIDIFRTSHPNAEYSFFSSAHGTFSRIDHILGHKSNLSKFKKTEIVSSIFSDHNVMRLNINSKKKTVKKNPSNTWRLNNTFLNNEQVIEEIKTEKKIPRNKWQWQKITKKKKKKPTKTKNTQQLRIYGMQQKGF